MKLSSNGLERETRRVKPFTHFVILFDIKIVSRRDNDIRLDSRIWVIDGLLIKYHPDL